MFIELTVAIHATIFPLDQPPSEPDANLAVVLAAVMRGHADGHPMTASEIASCVRMPRQSVKRRLDVLVERGVIQCIKRKYYLEPRRAKDVPHLDKINLILSEAFAVLCPYLSCGSPNR
jgi:hypothetical protein